MNMKKDSKKEGVTIQDIADRLDISASTVSRALKKNGRISQSTIDKVWRAAQEMGYQPSVPGYMVPVLESKVIGVLVPFLREDVYVQSIQGMQQQAKMHGYKLLVSSSENDPDQEIEILHYYYGLKLAGLVVSFCVDTKADDVMMQYVKTGVPVVNFHRANFDLPIPRIILDYYQGAYKACEHLIQQGCKRVVLLNSDLNCPVRQEVVNGHKAALSKAGLAYNKTSLVETGWNVGMYPEYVYDVLSSEKRPEAIIATELEQALEVISFAKDKELSIPGDVALVYIGSNRFNEFVVPSVSTIEYSSYFYGEDVFAQLIAQVEGGENEVETLVKATKLIIRASTMIV